MYSEESFAYCSGQCQASRYPPATCRCPCGGRNHGVLRYRSSPVINVTPQPEQYPFPEYRMINGEPVRYLTNQTLTLPAPENRTSIPAGAPETHGLIARKGKYRIAKTIGKSFKHALAGYSQTERNEQIWKGLRYQFNEERVNAVIAQAYTIRMQHDPEANQPELYELYETGEIDLALEHFEVRWVIGRPKK